MYMQQSGPPSLLLFQPSYRISATTQTSHLKTNPTKTKRRKAWKAGGKGEPKESKHLGNGVLYIHPQGRGDGLLGLVWTRSKPNPLFCLYCHLIQFIAPLFFLIISSYSLIFVFPYCKLPSSKQAMPLLRIGHRIERKGYIPAAVSRRADNRWRAGT